MSDVDADLRKQAEESVEEVIERLEKTIDFHKYKCARGLEATMAETYLPGFIDAHGRVQDFWDRFGDKVLRMAGYAGAIACFFAERESEPFGARDEKPREVTKRHWLMAMGVVRSACLAGTDLPDPRGLPCNHDNFALDQAVMDDVEKAFKSILAGL